MANIPGLNNEQQDRAYQINSKIMDLDYALENINTKLGYVEGSDITISKADLEIVIKAALKYQKNLLSERNEYLKIVEDNTKEPSFKM